jgi:predicted DNA-binding transcriptional regulator YafY
MTTHEHDHLAWRLTAILQKLNDGEALGVKQLADEFSVHSRTIQRDLNERFAFLPWEEREDGRYAIAPAYLGKLSFNDIARFAALAGLRGLFPALDETFLRELFDSRLAQTLDIHGPAYEDLARRAADFRVLRDAIGAHRLLCFDYGERGKDARPLRRVEVAPYRLINHVGIWYLAAVDKDRPKAYAFGKIHTPRPLEESFTPDQSIQKMLDDEDSIWLSEKKTEVILTVSSAAAVYFKRRKLIARQVIEKELEDKSLIVSGRFAHPNQILPIVRYWIPHVRIVSPKSWRDELEAGLQAYLADAG